MNFRLIFLLMLSLSSFAHSEGQYFISKNDFSSLFSDTIPDQLICTNETGVKFFVGFFRNATLKLGMKDDSKKTVLLSTIKFNDGKIEATEITQFWENKRTCTLPFDEINAISIRKMFITYATPYYDLDSLQRLHKFKSDSLNYSYTEIERLMIALIPKNGSTNDTIRLLENACYHIEAGNSKEIQYGVIKKIASDSIYITTVFASGPSISKENSQSDYVFLIQDITKIKLPKSNGMGVKTLLVNDYDILLKQAPKKLSYSPCWFSIDRVNGELNFFRLLLTVDGFKGIRYENGRYY